MTENIAVTVNGKQTTVKGRQRTGTPVLVRPMCAAQEATP